MPSVHLISRPEVDLQAARAHLDSVGGATWLGRRAQGDAEALIEFAERLCYRSWEPGLMTAQKQRPAIAATYAGLALTFVATIVPLVDRATANVLADHIRAGYPAYTPARIDTAATTYLIYLSSLGAVGVLCWLWTIRAVTAARRWACETATATFVLATAIAFFDLIVRDTSGDTGLPPSLGWVGMAPCLTGLLAVSFLWRKS
jgi:hypothetical protein